MFLHYYGNAGENQLMASLFRRGYDAFKLPVDYGMDVMALHRKSALTSAPGGYDVFFFQVKTISPGESSRSSQTGYAGVGRDTIRTRVSVSVFTLSQMLGFPHKALVIYLYDSARPHPELEEPDAPDLCFWLSGTDLAALSPRIRRDPASGEKSGGYCPLTFDVVFRAEDRPEQHTYVQFVPEEPGADRIYLGSNQGGPNGAPNHFSLRDFFRAAESASPGKEARP